MTQTTQPRSVWFLISSYYPTVGGGETHARLLARELAQRDWNITVLTRRRKTELARRELLEGTTILRVPPAGTPRLGKYLMLLPACWTLWRNRKNIDLLYVCGLRVLGLAGMIFGRMTGTPVVLRSEACGEWSGDFIFNSPHKAKVRGSSLVRLLVSARNRLYIKASRFLSISNVIHAEFVHGGIAPEQIADIPNGIDLAAYPPTNPAIRSALRSRLGLPHDRFIFSYSGKLNRGKGLETLIQAWEEVHASRPDAHLLLIGAGGQQFLSCEHTLRERVDRLGLASSVTFTGYVSNVVDYLRASDAFVFPSESEALGLALIEAMSCGLPALASATGGILDIIDDGENGRLLPPGDPPAWAKAMLQLLADPAQGQRWTEAGLRTTRERFSMDEVATRHEQLFNALIRP